MNKPVCKLIGTDGNVFAIIGNVGKSLKRAGLKDEAKEFTDKTFECGSYDAVLRLASEYVQVR